MNETQNELGLQHVYKYELGLLIRDEWDPKPN